MALERIVKLLEEGKLPPDELKKVLLKEAALLTLFEKKAHDLNNMLTPIIAYSDLLMASIPEDQEIKGILEMIKSSGERSCEEVKEMLTLARRGSYIMMPLGLNKLIYSFMTSPTYRIMHEKRPTVDVGITTDDDLYHINGNENALYHVIMNLVANSFDAIEDRGFVRISTKNESIDSEMPTRYGTIKAGKYAYLEVLDDGEGIPEENLDSIFDIHFSTRKGQRVFGGNGLGLPIVRDIIVEDHKGYIDIETERDKGTRFKIYIPAIDD